MEKKTIGSFLTALRKASGMTQRQLAEKLNVSDKAVSRWERDECAPDLSLIPVLAEIYGVTSDEILRGQRTNPDAPPRETDTAKSEKQRKRLLASAQTKFRTGSMISAVIAIIGLISACTCNFELGDLPLSNNDRKSTSLHSLLRSTCLSNRQIPKSNIKDSIYSLRLVLTFRFLQIRMTQNLIFRIVRFPISENSFEVVITNLDPEGFAPEELKLLYGMRWGIETAFRELRYTIGLLHFHTKKV